MLESYYISTNLDAHEHTVDNKAMRRSWLESRRHVYTEFLTQLAVAWFAGGIIAPIVVPTTTGGNNLLLTVLSLGASFLSLRLAVLFQKEHL